MHASRARALEVIGADAELDSFVDRFATRVASFDRAAVVTAVVTRGLECAAVDESVSTAVGWHGAGELPPRATGTA
jgi:hypothetical protein